MSAVEIDSYLAGLDEPHRSTLEELRRTIREVVPEAEEGLSYGAPAFKMGGRAIAGFVAHSRHLSYIPHSGDVLERLGADVAPYSTSKGSLRFPVDESLPRALVEKLIAERLREIG